MWMDFLPVVGFFIVFQYKGIYAATLCAMMISLLQLGWLFIQKQRIPFMQAATAIMIMIFGTATILLKNPMFIKLKPTVLYAILAAAFWATKKFSDQSLLSRMNQTFASLAPIIQTKLNRAFIIFFTSMSCLNTWVAYQYSTKIWVEFKLFGSLGLSLLFGLILAFYLSKWETSS
jgi:intracellular septation protein